jgi:phosphatidylglycerol:prolipoprotein diacylglycerol transferase
MYIDHIGIHFGSLFILRFYAMSLLAGILAAGVLIAYRAKRAGQNTDYLWDGLVWVVIGGIVGARIYHVLTPPPSMGITALDYLSDPLRAIAIWKGGLGVPGALVGGGIVAFFYVRRQGLDWWQWADFIAPGVALGQAVGRLGNFFNQELYGQPTNLPWAITIRPENRVPGYEAFSRFHPMFLYEMILNLLIVAGLIWIGRRFSDRLRDGDLLGLYAIFYGSGRFFLEFIKLDAPALGSALTIAQIVSLAGVAGGILFIAARHRFVARQSQSQAEPAR